jgi:phospholipid N-methyltransferase
VKREVVGDDVNREDILQRPSYLKAFISDPKVATIASTSPVTVEGILGRVNWDTVNQVLEYGPGRGEFTTQLLARLNPHGRLVAIENNPTLFSELQRAIKDSRYEGLFGSALDAEKLCKELDYRPNLIISGIPMSYLAEHEMLKVVREASSLLEPGGQFVLYQMWVPPFLPRMSLERALRLYFDVELRLELKNLPPLRVFVCRKS